MVVALFVVGIAVQILGVGVTLYGLDDVKRGLFPGSRIPIVSWARDATSNGWARFKAAAWWVLRKLHLRRGRTVVGIGAAEIGVTGESAKVRVGSAPLRLPRRDEERWPWVLATMDTLRLRMDNMRNDLADQIANVSDEHAAQVEELRVEMATTAQDATAAFAVKLYGDAGHGLNVAALGIALALTGSVVATITALAL